MSAHEDEVEGIRGGELADDATGAAPPPAGAEPLGQDGLRGDGLADDAESATGTAPDPDERAKGGLRGGRPGEGRLVS